MNISLFWGYDNITDQKAVALLFLLVLVSRSRIGASFYSLGLGQYGPCHLPILFFSGDTNKNVLTKLPFGEFKYFIIESTFIAEEHLECLQNKEHLHYNNLEPYFKNYPDTTFILIHFSQKYTKKHLDEFKSKNKFKNVVFFY